MSSSNIKYRIFEALDQNIDYRNRTILGVPASHLDESVFYHDIALLKDAPFLSTMVHNPNHIGCHTLGESESFFKGTHELEKELINLCAEDILRGNQNEQDGYVASGGTESNLQAIWIYRNFFMKEYQASIDQIGIIGSEDCHYSIPKAADILNIGFWSINVTDENRVVDGSHLMQQLEKAESNGVKYFIVVANMMTTMFGSVDTVDSFVTNLEQKGFEYKVHIDAAYGGFVYPFSCKKNQLDFSNPLVSSVTLDAHKMVQAPFGTGIFLCRKNLIQNVYTDEAQYVQGLDATVSGSRSGANAIAVWMILQSYGPNGWYEKIHILQFRTDWLCRQLDELEIEYFREPYANQVAIRSNQLSAEIAAKFGLVPDTHDGDPKWYKIVVMEHVTVDVMEPFIEQIAGYKGK
jgi:glutamate/tyrosine decarboxylase-like PLP-dependent enzyme